MSSPSSPRKIFPIKDNPPTEHDSKQEQPKKPRSAFICYRDAKKDEILKGPAPPDQKKRLLSLVAAEWRNLSPTERYYWEEKARDDNVRYIREKKEFKGVWVLPKKRAKKDPDAPKRPPSAFLSFSKVMREKIKKENPDIRNTDISRLLGEMWRHSTKAELAPYREAELKQREAYKEEVKKWRESKAQADAASRTSHHMVQQIQRHVYPGPNSFDPFPHVHSVEEAVQKVDRGFPGFQMEDYAPEPFSYPMQSVSTKPSSYSSGYRSYENNHPSYRPRRALPTNGAAPRGSYPFRPYHPTGTTSPQAAYATDDSPTSDHAEEGDRYPTTSRYFDRPRHSPYGFYQYH